MTLILSFFTPDWVVQVCDSRISYGASGKAPFDAARKLLLYDGHGSKLSIAYTGLASIHERDHAARPLEVWLGDVAPALSAKAPSVPAFAASLMAALDAATTSTRELLPEADIRLSVIMAGFVDPTAPAGAICLSNFQRGGYRLPLSPHAAAVPIETPADVIYSVGSFNYTVLLKKSGSGLLIHGDHRLLRPPISVILQAALRRATAEDDPRAVRQALVECLSALMTKNPTGTVSADCWSCVMWRGGAFGEFQSHFTDQTKQSLNPTYISQGMRATSVLVSLEESPAQRSAREKLEAGIIGQRIDTPTLLAYLDWSPRIRTMAAEIEKAGLEVTRAGYVVELLEMIKQGEFTYLTILENRLSQAGAWADDFAKEALKVNEKAAENLRREAENSPPLRYSVDRDDLLALLLIALDPDKYSAAATSGSIRRYVTDERKATAKRYNPRFL